MSKSIYLPTRTPQGPISLLKEKERDEKEDDDDDEEMEEDPVDTGVIRCICSSSDDDGFTIQCERCLVWQHAFCVNIDQSNIPEHYLCDKCELKMKDERRHEFYRFRKDSTKEDTIVEGQLMERKRSLTFVDTSYANESSATKRKGERTKGRLLFTREKRPGIDTSRRHSQPRTTKKPKLSKRIAISQDTLHGLDSSELISQSLQKKLPYKRGYISTNYNTVKSKFVKQIFKEARERWSQQGKWKACVWKNGTSRRPDDQSRSKECPYIIMDTASMSASTKVSVQLMTLSNSYTSRKDQCLRKGVFLNAHVRSDWFLMEINGDIVLKSEYKFSPTNNFAELGTQQEHVLFYPALDLCIDARYNGNDGRYIRRSCHPNAEMRNIIVSHPKEDTTIHLGIFTREEIKAGQEVTLGWNWQRGHIAWQKSIEWHHQTPGTNDQHQVIDEEEERKKRKAVKRMLSHFYKEFGNCACQDTTRCFIEYLQREANGEKNRKTWEETKALIPGRSESDVPSNAHTLKRKQEKGTRRHGVHGTDIPLSSQHSRQLVVSPSNSKTEGLHKSMSFSFVDTIEENGEIDVTSNSPGASSPTPSIVSEREMVSEEELDVDGDIDIGNDPPTSCSDQTRIREALSTRDMSDQEDFSSLTSLSSLSGFEDTANEASEDERRLKTKSRRSGQRREDRHQNSKSDAHNEHISKKTYNAKDITESQNTAVPLSMLPFKKRWMCNYREQTSHSIDFLLSENQIDQTHKDKLQNLEWDVENNCMEMNPIGESLRVYEQEEVKQVPSKPILTKEPHSEISAITDSHRAGNTSATAHDISMLFADLEESYTDQLHEARYTLDEYAADDDELSDASSASTLPLDNDDRKPSKMTLISSVTSTSTMAERVPSPDIKDTSLSFTQSDTMTTAPDSQPFSIGSDVVISIEDSLKKKEETPQTNAVLEINEKEEDTNMLAEVKPTKIKLSIQEYLSRRSTYPLEPTTETPTHSEDTLEKSLTMEKSASTPSADS